MHSAACRRIRADGFSYVAQIDCSQTATGRLTLQHVGIVHGSGACYHSRADPANKVYIVAVWHPSKDEICKYVVQLHERTDARVLVYNRIRTDEDFYGYFPTERPLPWYRDVENRKGAASVFLLLMLVLTLGIGIVHSPTSINALQALAALLILLHARFDVVMY